MTSRLRPLVLALTVAAATIVAPAATGGAAACAAEGPRAGLVIDTGARAIELCVVLDAVEVSGLHLIELAAAQHGLSYGFGLGGAAVCRLDGVGPAGSDCFAEYPEYWGYWHGDGRGGWNWASTGAGAYRVGDGDLEGWVWGTGDSGATHREPPTVGIDEICAPPPPSPEPTREPEPTQAPTRSEPPTASSTARSTTSASPSSSVGTDDAVDQAREGGRTRTPAPTASATVGSSSSDPTAPALALGASPPSDGGPPTAMLAAVLLALLLGAGGWLRLRSRTRGPA